jgi:hypothetical protein
MDAVLTYLTGHLGIDDWSGFYDGHRLLAAARAFQCRFADLVELADHWLDDAWPGLTSALGPFLDREGSGGSSSPTIRGSTSLMEVEGSSASPPSSRP